MDAIVNDKLNEITNRVLRDEPDMDMVLYTNRLQLLYSVILNEIYENETVYNCEVIVDQICSFESSQLCLTEMSMDQYRNITPDIANDVFSTVAYGLAVERLKGENYFGLSEMLSTVYQEMIGSVEGDKMTVSESLLDFNFASGGSEIMSLRLKRQWDALK